jgi:SAM-dependent methyltransferase
MLSQTTCPNCLRGELETFYEVHRVPVHSVLLMPTRQVAVSYPKGDIALGFCPVCGFISNTLFDATVHEYSGNYEETQGFSPTFRAFHKRLAESLIEKYALRSKKIVEIGCGKGEFLGLICELGNNQGIGFDPAFVAERNPARKDLDITFVADFYSEKYAHVGADFFCCKMTLEHIPDTAHFIQTVRRAVGDRRDSIVFFQVPDARRVLRDLAFWDIYYEHCSYFSAGSLARVFREAGFEVLETWTDYDDQYLMISARPATEAQQPGDLERDAPGLVKEDIEYFVKQQAARIEGWKQEVASLKERGRRAVVWGSGSKGVAFLSALGGGLEIEYVVDINPFRQGKFMAGTGQEIVSPSFLSEYKPDVAIAMNPIYQGEIQDDLKRMGLPTVVQAV